MAIVIVTYNPNIILLEHTLSELNDYQIVISDNNSSNFEEIKKISFRYNFHLIKLSDNLGIGVAQNESIKYILSKKKADFIFFMDQDSFILKSELITLTQDYIKLNHKYKKIAAICATIGEIKKNQYKTIQENISSGTLIPINMFKEIGLMYDSLFIDWIDYEWCWRAIKEGYFVVKDYNCIMQHQIGTQEKIFGKLMVAPFRLYYVFRNTIILLKEKRTLNQYEWKFFLVKQFIFNILFCPDRILRFKYICRGIKDGKLSRKGKLKV